MSLRANRFRFLGTASRELTIRRMVFSFSETAQFWAPSSLMQAKKNSR